jgi:hypothetical protein
VRLAKYELELMGILKNPSVKYVSGIIYKAFINYRGLDYYTYLKYENFEWKFITNDEYYDLWRCQKCY